MNYSNCNHFFPFIVDSTSQASIRENITLTYDKLLDYFRLS